MVSPAISKSFPQRMVLQALEIQLYFCRRLVQAFLTVPLQSWDLYMSLLAGRSVHEQ